MSKRELVVQKYGGSSLSSPAQVREIARRIAGRARGARIIVTVSAMGQSTDQLLRLAHKITPEPPQRELDMLLTVGERISMALLSMALNAIGCGAISLTGSQCGIVTNLSHTRALIEEIRGDRIREALDQGKVVIVAGFQGVSRAREITTLGRGGSDTTAVALAASLGAACCEIYSDFPGVFTGDPRVVEDARRIASLGYDEMLELAALGAKVLHYRAAEIARRYRVPMNLSSSSGDPLGTEVRGDSSVERKQVLSVTSNDHVTVVRMTGPAGAYPFADLPGRLAEADIQIVGYHRDTYGDDTALTLVVDEGDASKLAPLVADLPTERRDDLATVSVVGLGFACNAGAVSDLERVLAEAGIPVHLVETSSLSVTCLVPRPSCHEAIRRLHEAFLSNDPAE